MSVFAFEFMQRAFIATIVVCAVAPVLGGFVVQRRQSLIGDGMGHVAFAGVGLAFLLGVSPLAGAAALSVVAAFALFRLQRTGLGGDLALALIFYGGIALGFLLLSRAGMGINQVLGLLFGSPLNLTWAQVAVVVALAVAVLAAVVALYGPLTAMAFDEQAARVGGVPVDGLVLTLTLGVGLLVVGGMQVLGILLVAAMLVVPVAAAAQLARSYRGTMLGAAAIGAASAFIGLLAGFYADATPGASIVLSAIAAYAVAALIRTIRDRLRTGRLTARAAG